MRLATERRTFSVQLPPEVDFLERVVGVTYVVRPDEPVEIVGTSPAIALDARRRAALAEMCEGHVYLEGTGNGTV